MPAEGSDVIVPAEAAPQFGAYYYAHDCGIPYGPTEHWIRFFQGIATHIVTELAPASVLDAGCALGLLVEQLVRLGVDAHGIDISEYAIANAPEEVRDRCRLASLVEPIDGQYDLVVTIEVLEHMTRVDAEAALDNLCSVSEAVLFSSSPHDYGEPTHVNVQPPERWAELFARRGFYRDLEFDASFITDWAVLYRRSSRRLPDIVRDYERVLTRRAVEVTQVRSSLLALQERLEKLTAGGELEPLADLRAERDRLADQLVDARMQLLAARDQIIGAETALGRSEAERERLASYASSVDQAMHEFELMRNSRAWRALSMALGPYRRYRASRTQ